MKNVFNTEIGYYGYMLAMYSVLALILMLPIMAYNAGNPLWLCGFLALMIWVFFPIVLFKVRDSKEH